MASENEGLDMGPTIAWYEQNRAFCIDGIPKPDVTPFPFKIKNSENIHLSEWELSALFQKFPEESRFRIRQLLDEIVGKPSAWFKENPLTAKADPTTTDKLQAISPAAIIPSYTDYAKWTKENPAADIVLYKIDESACSHDVRKIIHAEGFVHELAHVLLAPAQYVGDCRIEMPDRRVLSGDECIEEFANLAEKHPPISSYSSNYREGHKFAGNLSTSISEEFAETVAAMLLGFSFCGDDSRSKAPLKDRADVDAWVYNLLNAKRVD